MTLLEWKDEYSVGVPAVDQEHRELIGLINDLHALLGPAARSADIEAVLGDIHAQIAAHFALEEQYMRATRYAGYGAHKEDHEALLDQLRDIMDRIDAGGALDDDALSAELDRWFSEHFRTHDARLHKHFAAR